MANSSQLQHAAHNSRGYVTSKEMLLAYVHRMSNVDIRKLLIPVRDGILTENTVLHMNTQNFSVDHVVVPITIHDFLKEVSAKWVRWIHSVPGANEYEEGHYPSHVFDNHAHDIPNEQIIEHINNLDKHQKRAILNLAREGVLTDECFINLSSHRGPERVEIPMPRVVEALRAAEAQYLELHKEKPWLLKVIYLKHYSSACFEKGHHADLDVRSLSAARFTMPVWYTAMFTLMTLGTFASHIWSQATNYEGLQESLQLTTPTIILVLSSLLIGMLLYLAVYMVGFLFCCENNYKNQLVTKDLDYSFFYVHFCELSYFEKRIYLVKTLQFVLLWYTVILTIFTHEHDLNIYPAIFCVLTNGFGLMMFARIAEFFRKCRRTRKGTAIAAR